MMSRGISYCMHDLIPPVRLPLTVCEAECLIVALLIRAPFDYKLSPWFSPPSAIHAFARTLRLSVEGNNPRWKSLLGAIGAFRARNRLRKPAVPQREMLAPILRPPQEAVKVSSAGTVSTSRDDCSERGFPQLVLEA